jgi:hypothetical protein
MLLGAVAAIGVANLIGFAFAPALLTHAPLVLIALSPVGRHLVLAATVTPIIPFVIVGTARRMIVAALGYALGRAYGGHGVSWVKTRYPRLEPALRLLEWSFARAAPLILFVSPGPLVCALAGATGMRAWVALPIATAGQFAWMLVNYKVGEAFAAWLAPITAFIEAYMMPMTLACIALALAYHWVRRRRQLGAMHAMAGAAHEVAPPDQPPSGSSEQQRP